MTVRKLNAEIRIHKLPKYFFAAYILLKTQH